MNIALLLFSWLFSLVNASSSCSGFANCSSCVSNGCTFCAIKQASDNSVCHLPGSLFNPCHNYESISSTQLCSCVPSSCAPKGGLSASACHWYTDGNIENPPSDPKTWRGADFLPLSYRSAASCACSGGGNPLWQTPAASCIRTYLLGAHQGLSNQLKMSIRNATLDWDPTTEFKYVNLIYNMHVQAYKSCCCSGAPAPLIGQLLISQKFYQF